MHLAEVVTVEDREGTTFVGLDTGWNVLCEHFVYRIPFFPILCRAADAPPVRDVTFSGHINEGPDLFAEDHPFPEVREGDIVALPNVGSYNASMTSFHCMREPAGSVHVRGSRMSGDRRCRSPSAGGARTTPATASRCSSRSTSRRCSSRTCGTCADETPTSSSTRPTASVRCARRSTSSPAAVRSSPSRRTATSTTSAGSRSSTTAAATKPTRPRPRSPFAVRIDRGAQPDGRRGDVRATTASRCPNARSSALPHEDFDDGGLGRTGGRADVVRRRRRRDRPRRPPSSRCCTCPGTPPGSIALWEAETGLLFSGDTAYVDARLRFDDLEAAEASLAPAGRAAGPARARGARPQLRRRRAGALLARRPARRRTGHL